jgi:hypothetical protein
MNTSRDNKSQQLSKMIGSRVYRRKPSRQCSTRGNCHLRHSVVYTPMFTLSDLVALDTGMALLHHSRSRDAKAVHSSHRRLSQKCGEQRLEKIFNIGLGSRHPGCTQQAHNAETLTLDGPGTPICRFSQQGTLLFHSIRRQILFIVC